MFEKELTDEWVERLFRTYHEEMYRGKPTYSREEFESALRNTDWEVEYELSDGHGYSSWVAKDIVDIFATRYDDERLEFDAGE